MAMVSFEHVGKMFHGIRDVAALQDVTFTANDGISARYSVRRAAASRRC